MKNDTVSRNYIKNILADLLDEYSELDENNLHDPKWCGVSECYNVVDSAPPQKPHIGRWKRKEGSYMTPGGTPIFVCAECGGTEHLHGAEFPYRKMYCEDCGSINAYPWEKLYEEEN